MTACKGEAAQTKTFLNGFETEWEANERNQTGVMCSCLLLPVKNHAAAFCTRCRQEREAWLIPVKRELQ